MALKNHIPFGPAPVGEPLLVHKTGDGASVVVRDNEPWTLWFTRLTAQTNDAMFNCCAQADRWTPEHTNRVNLTASSARLSQYSLTGNFVTFSGQFDVTPMLPGVATSFEMSLPVASSFGFDYEAGGTAGARDSAGQVAAIFANVDNGTLQVQWVAGDTSSRTMNFSGSYWVTNAAPPPYPPLHITTPCPTDEPVLDEAYSYQFEATGGKKPYHWTATGLPDGMTINEFTGILGGAPTESGTFSYTITVADSQTPTPFTDSLDCEFVIAGDTCTPWSVSVQDDITGASGNNLHGFAVDEDFIYWAGYGPSVENEAIYRFNRADGSFVDSLTIPNAYSTDTPRMGLFGLYQDADYLYTPANYTHGDPFGANFTKSDMIMISKSTFTIVTTTNVVPEVAWFYPDTGGAVAGQCFIANNYIYFGSTSSSNHTGLGTTIFYANRLSLADFTTLNRFALAAPYDEINIPYNRCWADSSNLYFMGWSGLEDSSYQFSIFKITLASFSAINDVLIVDTVNTGFSSLNDNESFTSIYGDGTYVYAAYSSDDGDPDFNTYVGIARINKGSFTLSELNQGPVNFDSPNSVADNQVADGHLFFYIRTPDLTLGLMRVSVAGMTFETMSFALPEFQVPYLLNVTNMPFIDGDEATFPWQGFTPSDTEWNVQKICEFVPD